jgi:protoporphyrinogen oxidase
MFEFVFKMFGEGVALLPKGGIEQISKQLTDKLTKTTFLFDTKVKTVKDGHILLENGEKIEVDYTIIATEAHQLVPNLNNQQTEWKSCQALYFTTPKRVYQAPFIGLVTNKDSLLNNIFYHTSLPTASQGKGELLSVTVIKSHQLSEEALIQKVQQELQQECGIENTTFLKMYPIPKALPQLNNLQYEIQPSETRLTDTIFLAGDVQLNGSLNAAMIAGERAATAILSKIEQTQKQH